MTLFLFGFVLGISVTVGTFVVLITVVGGKGMASAEASDGYQGD